MACILSMKTPQPRQNLTRRASETCNSASSRLMAPSATMSTAIFTATGGDSLGIAGLEDKQPAVLDGEFDVLSVMVVGL